MQIGTLLSQNESLGRSGLRGPILHPPFDSIGCSYYDMLFLHERLYQEGCCVSEEGQLLHRNIPGFCPLPELGPKFKGSSLLCCLCHSAQPIPSRVMDTFNSNGRPAWEMPRAFICFTGIFAFSEAAVALIPYASLKELFCIY